MKTSNTLHTSHPLRWLAATFVVALAATVAQTAQAQPFAGGEGMMAGHGMGMGPGMGHRGHGFEGGQGHPRMMERLLDSVNATAEQRTQIKQITEAARADMKAQHEAGRQLRRDGAALFAQPSVDARAAEALRQQMVAQHDQASKRRMQMMLDVSRVLTPEQRKSLADRMQQRQSMMERHRAERAAVEGKPAR